MIESIVGFDTATKVYSQLIGNVMIDCCSAVKYWYFIRLMGRAASHLVLECALQTKPNIVLISEEIEANDWNLDQIVNFITDIVVQRLKNKLSFGTVLIPEGLLVHLPAIRRLISELTLSFQKHESEEH